MPQAALQRWLLALNARGELAAVVEAVSPDCELCRFGWGEEADVVKERFVGPEAVSAWLRRSPAGTVFQAEGPLTADGAGWVQPYLVRVEHFQNRGRWILRLAPDGRIASLEHRPEALPPQG